MQPFFARTAAPAIVSPFTWGKDRLELQGRGELDRTAASYPVDACTAPDRACHLSEGRAGDGILGTVELRTVAQLKGVRARLQRDAFPYGKGLEERDVVLNVSGAVIRVPANIAQYASVRYRACSCLGSAGGLPEA